MRKFFVVALICVGITDAMGQSKLEGTAQELVEKCDYVALYRLLSQSDTNAVKGNPVLCRRLAIAAATTGQYEQATTYFSWCVRLYPEDPRCLNEAAWFFATAGNRQFRDGDRAVQLGLKACRLTQFKNASYIDTTAAGYAEAGDFAKAIKGQQRAVELSNGAAAYKETYELFKARRTVPDGYPGDGEVVVENTTSFDLKIRMLYYARRDGTIVDREAIWDIKPNKHSRLLLGGDAFRVSSLSYELESEFGITPEEGKVWVARYGGREHTKLKLTQDQLKGPRPKRVAMAKAPIPNAPARIPLPSFSSPGQQPDSSENGLQKAGDLLKQIGDLKQQKDELTGRSEGTTFGGVRDGIRITVKSVDVSGRKTNGKAWDFFGGEPDVRVYIKRKKVLGGQGHTKTRMNRFTFTTDETILGAKKGDTIEIKVVDIDEADNDLIGVTEIELDSGTIRRGKRTLSFGQVEELVLYIEN